VQVENRQAGRSLRGHQLDGRAIRMFDNVQRGVAFTHLTSNSAKRSVEPLHGVSTRGSLGHPSTDINSGINTVKKVIG